VSPGRKPWQKALTSQPATNTTSAPAWRTASARSAQSAKSASACAGFRSTGNGENHASSPASAACPAATLSRSGSRPEMRTASQYRSPAMTAISRLTAWESKVFLVRLFPGNVPVS
jgi:hypothetical protein